MRHPYLATFILCNFLRAVLSNAQIRAPENVPIGFYAKVLDQDGQPVTNAKVTFDIIHSFTSENRTESTPTELHTDQNGNFAVTRLSAYGIDKLSIQKSGYELSHKVSRGYIFGLNPDYKPNEDNPEIFRMWKQNGKEPLVFSQWHGKVLGDGTPLQFDLVSGTPTAGGDLEIICKRLPLRSPPLPNDHFDYTFKIAISGGGIQQTDDEFTYLAPKGGFSSAVVVLRKGDDSKWQSSVSQEFYVKTANGKYGRLYVDWEAWQTPKGILKWECSINPSNSRNLER